MPNYMMALLVAFLIGGSRWIYETSLVISVADAQGGAWLVYSLVVSGVTILIVFLFAYLALRFHAKQRRILATLCILGVILLAGVTARSIVHLREIRVALSDAADPTTSPERLRSLVGYQTGFGYELDNRLASNPGTPIDVLRLLHKKGQVGTEMSLAGNPNTPGDILIAIADRKDDYAQKWIQQSLRMRLLRERLIGPTREWTAERRKSLPRLITLPPAPLTISIPDFSAAPELGLKTRTAVDVALAIDRFWRTNLRPPTETEVPRRHSRVRFTPTHHSLFADLLDSNGRVQITVYAGGEGAGVKRYDEPRLNAFAVALNEFLGSDPPETNAVGNMIADAMRADADADFALHNFLGHRGDIPAGLINDTIVAWVIPFHQNRLIVVKLTGEEISQAIGFAEAGGRPWCISGGRATLQPPAADDKWANARVVDAKGRPVDPRRIYRVAVSDYCHGLPGFYGPIDGEIEERRGTMRDVLRRHLQRLKKVRPDRIPRIIRPPGTTRANPFNR